MDADSPKIGIDALFELTGSGREAKAYAFLYAAFRRTEVSKNPVRDTVDCLAPFIAPYIASIVGKQVSVEGLQKYLKSNFGFDIPLYAIEQLIPSLRSSGYVEYNRIVKAYIALDHKSEFEVAKADIETDFDQVVAALSSHANKLGFTTAPPSGTWGEALISFLRSRHEKSRRVSVTIRKSMLDAGRVESTLIGGFIGGLHDNNPQGFDRLLRIFMGILIEEFISSVSEIGSFDKSKSVKVLYDTAVLLRLMGCSGKMLKTATVELNRYLQDIGFECYYFSGNEAEVAGILSTIVFVKDTGAELTGETADAISAGEVNISEIRMLQNTFPEHLATYNVFPANDLEQSALANAMWQIDEKQFAANLLARANESGRAYGAQNREHDASYLGTIMRLRKKLNTRDLAKSGYVFVTTNKFLAQISRRYLIEQKIIQPQHCPPILGVGQVATIAWLMKDQQLAPEKAGKELLSNCFAAIRPDAEWFRFFREGMEKVTGSLDEYSKDGSNSLTLQAARRMAQEESFSNSALVRELNMAEILSRAKAEDEAREQARQAELKLIQGEAAAEREALITSNERQRLADAQDAEEARRLATIDAAKAAKEEVEERIQQTRLSKAIIRAGAIIGFWKFICVASFVLATTAVIYLQMESKTPPVLWGLLIVLSVFTLFGLLDLLKISWANRTAARIKQMLVELLMQV